MDHTAKQQQHQEPPCFPQVFSTHCTDTTSKDKQIPLLSLSLPTKHAWMDIENHRTIWLEDF